MVQLVVPMSGSGNRFKQAGYSKLKPLIEVDGKTYIEHVINMFPNIDETLFIINKDEPQRDDLIRLLRKLKPESKIAEIDQHKNGPSWAISKASEYINEDDKVIVSYCDFKAIWSFEDMVNQLDLFDASVLTYTGFHPHMLRSTKFAYVKKDSEDVVEIQEKNSYTDNPMSEEASAGVYGFKSGSVLLDAIKYQIENKIEFNGEFYTSLTIRAVLEMNLRVGTVLGSHFCQWGTPEDLVDWQHFVSATRVALAKPINKVEEVIPGVCLILAAGRGSRLANVSGVSKPNIPIGDKRLWDYSLDIALRHKTRAVATRNEVELVSNNASNIDFVILDNITEGQAHTAEILLDAIDDTATGPVTFLSTDNLIEPSHAKRSYDRVLKCDLLIWTCKRYPSAEIRPEQYSWVNVDSQNQVLGTNMKSRPLDFVNSQMIIGNFTFRSKELARSLIEALRVQGIRVNGEYYLDSVIDIALQLKLRVEAMEVENFMAIGNQIEYDTFNYYVAGFTND